MWETFSKEEVLAYRRQHRGVIGVQSKVPVRDASALSLLYTPGVAAVCLEIADHPDASFDYTCRGNTIAMLSDGSAMLEVGNGGSEAALPVLEGKSVIFKTFAGVDAFPIVLKSQDTQLFISTAVDLLPGFGAITIEDVSSPRAFTIERILRDAADVPVFHSHAYGTGVVVLAALLNSLKLVGKDLHTARIVINGAGAAGIGTARLLLAAGVDSQHLIVCDRIGSIHANRSQQMNWAKWELAKLTNRAERNGKLDEMLKDADVLIGLSAANVVTKEMVASMAKDAIVYALAVPTPEISEDDAKAAGARVTATDLSGSANQLDMSLVNPGVLRGLLDTRARTVNNAMLIAAADALAGLVSDEDIARGIVIPQLFDFRVAPAVAAAVARVANETGEARLQVDPAEVATRTRTFTYEGSLPLRPRQKRSANGAGSAFNLEQGAAVDSSGRQRQAEAVAAEGGGEVTGRRAGTVRTSSRTALASEGGQRENGTPSEAVAEAVGGDRSGPAQPTSGSAVSIAEEAVELHRRYGGVLEIRSKIPVRDDKVLELFYLPPYSSAPAAAIKNDPMAVYDYTTKSNLVAVITDGSAVLGLGNIGPRAALPVMEGKAVLFNTFAGVEAFPICIATQDPAEFIQVVQNIAGSFGGINLEDIAAPRCFEVEAKLRELCDIPIFHDDQHGTAVVVLAALVGALRVVGKQLGDIRVVFNGAGAAGIACAKLLLSAGVADVLLCDRRGAIYSGRKDDMNPFKDEIASFTNKAGLKGKLADVVRDADVFIGVSQAGALTQDMVRSMAERAIVFGLANPVPEIWPEEAKAAGAAVVATGRSDLANQVNNSLAFPGIFRGALDTRARQINEAMKIAAANAISDLVTDRELTAEYIIPKATDYRVAPKVAAAVARAAIETGEARLRVDPAAVEANTRSFIYEGRLELLEPIDA